MSEPTDGTISPAVRCEMVVGEYIFRKNQSTVEGPEESDRGIAS